MAEGKGKRRRILDLTELARKSGKRRGLFRRFRRISLQTIRTPQELMLHYNVSCHTEKLMTTHFIQGSLWELTSNANYIPAGSYTFLGLAGEFLLFGVENKIQFGLTKDYYRHLLRPVPRRRAKPTSTSEFIERYLALAREPREAPGPEGFTFCAMDPSLARKYKKLRQWQRSRIEEVTVH